MQNKTFLQKLSNRQFELLANLIGFAIMGLSLVDFTSKILVVLLVIAAPAIFGYAVALILDYFDDKYEYKVEMSSQSHLRFGLLTSVVMGVLATTFATQVVLATQLVVLPFSQTINSFLLMVPPKTLFFIWGTLVTGLGYFLAWKTAIPNEKHHQQAGG